MKFAMLLIKVAGLNLTLKHQKVLPFFHNSKLQILACLNTQRPQIIFETYCT